MAMPGTETVRFRRPTSGPNAVHVKKEEPKFDQFGAAAATGWKRRHQGLLQDQVRRRSQGPLIPSLSVAFRTLMLVRTFAAMYSIISDCDEVFNFWEPLHYFQHNSGFQTWELSPEFAIRSWAYVLLHLPFAKYLPRLLALTKRGEFFTLRMFLAAASSFCEAKFYRAVVDVVNERVGRYVLFAMLFTAGMFSASVAFLPSTFTMYTTMLAMSYSLHPATSTPTGVSRAYKATIFFALGAILGWPFSVLLGVPFVLEQVFLTGGDIAVGRDKGSLTVKRWATMGKAVALGALIAVPVYLIDSWAYGRPVLPTLNILYYNLIFPLGGSDLYGTSPAQFYLSNLFLNFNFLLPMALLSLPALAVTYVWDHKRLGATQMAPKPGATSPYTLVVMRLLPFYLWLGVLSAQAHKEERFFFPAYPLLCLNACVTLYLIRGWAEKLFVYFTKSPYRASQTPAFSNFTLMAILITGIISLTRSYALYRFYHAPLDVAFHFQYRTVPTILAGQGYTATMPPKSYRPGPGEVVRPIWDYTALLELEPRVTVCYGAEWHRYPSSYLVPDGVDVEWLQTDFNGMMPRRWEASEGAGAWPRAETRVTRSGRFNGQNRASSEAGAYVPSEKCDYLVTLSTPSKKLTSLEPDYLSNPAWEIETCRPFLDAASSAWWARLVYLPFDGLDSGRVYGEYCLLKRKDSPYTQTPQDSI